jgi:hypothetical protein
MCSCGRTSSGLQLEVFCKRKKKRAGVEIELRPLLLLLPLSGRLNFWLEAQLEA